MASSFGVATPAAEESRFAAGQEQALKRQSTIETVVPAAPPVTESKPAESKRPNTVYDPADAYGGI